MNILVPKIWSCQIGHKTQIGDFLKNGSNNFDYISLIYGVYFPKLNCSGISSGAKREMLILLNLASLVR
jgi:hypothetical protein